MNREEIIKPEDVVRDEYGSWTHSAWAQGEDEDEEYVHKSWFSGRGLEVCVVELEYEDEASPAYQQYFETGDDDFSAWEPSRPEGEGWFIFSIHDTDDGPICVWVRQSKSIKNMESTECSA